MKASQGIHLREKVKSPNSTNVFTKCITKYLFANYIFIKSQTTSEVEFPKLTKISSVKQTIYSFTLMGYRRRCMDLCQENRSHLLYASD